MPLKSTTVRRILYGVLLVFIFFLILLLTPRTLGFLFPEKIPVGYHFNGLAYMAVGAGIEKLADLNPGIPPEVTEFKNVEYKYINGRSLQLDIYKPTATAEALPLLVFVHGGSWKGGKRSDYMVYLIRFAEMGYATATVSYRLLRDSIFPAAVEDVRDAVQWLTDHADQYGFDRDRIAIIGGSAGAHLAMLTAYGWKNGRGEPDEFFNRSHLPAIKAVVDIYGPADLTTEYARNQTLVANFLGFSYDENPDLFRLASPVSWLHDDCPPTLIFHGTSDRLVPVSQSDLLKRKLDSLEIVNEYYRLPLWPHVMDISKKVNDFMVLRMDVFFRKHLW